MDLAIAWKLSKHATLATLACCAATTTIAVPMSATYRKPDAATLADGSTIVLETGESFDIAVILTLEATRPQKVLVHRTNGRYLLVADGFRHAYLLDEHGETARGVAISLGASASQVEIQAGIASRCAAVRYGEAKVLFVAPSGQTSFSKCPEGK